MNSNQPKLTPWENNPILKPIPGHKWEQRGVLNPAAWYENGKVSLLYRVAGAPPDYVIAVSLAESSDGFNFKRISDEPVLKPRPGNFDGGCVEDPRIVKFGDMFYVTYAARPYPPGPYWEEDGEPWNAPDDAPEEFKGNLTRSGIALSKDLKNFEERWPLTSYDVDDRDVVIFPEKINGKYVMLRRPANWIGEKYGCDVPVMWIAWSDDLHEWTDSTIFAKPEFDWETLKIGASTPPLRIDEGWFLLYHAVDSDYVYRVGAMIVDANDPCKILARTPEPILEPTADFEKDGLFPNVVFPTGNVVIDGKLFVYYGGGDEVCCVATADFKKLVADVMRCGV